MKRKSAVLVLLFVIIYLLFIANVSIVGPYSGTVTDRQTGVPIEGASVLISWSKVTPNAGGGYTENVGASLVSTDKKGEYNSPRKFYYLGFLSFMTSTNVVIYQPGYQAYIESDSSFKEKNNIVKLDRIPANFSYKEHYEKIDRALGGIDSFQYPDGVRIEQVWKTFIDRNLKSGILEKDEFLRRAEWEEKRSMQEYRR